MRMIDGKRDNRALEKDEGLHGENDDYQNSEEENDLPYNIEKANKVDVKKLIRPALYPITQLEEENFADVSIKSNKTIPSTTGSKIRSPNVKEEVTATPIYRYSIWIIVVSVILVVVAAYWQLYSPVDSNPPVDKGLNIAELMTDLKANFKGQPPLSFRIIELAVKRVTFKDPEAPGIIILLASKESTSVSNRLARHLVEHISSDFVSIKPDRNVSPENMKVKIQNSIEKNVTQGKLKAIFVENLDQFPFDAAMMFHSYCDHENAPLKKVVYVMTVSSDEVLPDSDTKKWDEVATECLNTAWQNSGKDQVSSLISRLTVSVSAVVGSS